jgi:hypothetical protein
MKVTIFSYGGFTYCFVNGEESCCKGWVKALVIAVAKAIKKSFNKNIGGIRNAISAR